MADKIFSIADGSHDELPSITTAIAGRFLITTDTGEMYYEPEDKKRVKINNADQTYTPDSDNAQSGKAVSEAINNNTATNLRNGSSVGSIRFIGSTKEDSSYKLGRYAMAEGLGTQSGSKAFTIIGVNKTNKTYTLDSVEGLAINDVYSAHVLYTTGGSSQAENYGKITAINGNVITVDNLWCEGEFATSDSYISGGYDGEKNTFRIIAKPNVGTRVIGDISHAEGVSTKALSKGSHAEGKGTVAHGSWSHAEGNNTKAGYSAHAEGNSTKATGFNSHAEGNNTTSSGFHSHAEGNGTTASGFISHAEGSGTTSSGGSSHAEGNGTDASDFASHAEGNKTKAIGFASHAEGSATEASGITAHAEGDHTVASGDTSHVQGRYNIPNDNYADVIGNGSSNTDRSNAYTMDWNGNTWFAGDVYVGSTSGTNKDEGSKKLATEEYVAIEQKRADNTFANALKASKSDTAMLIDDVSPVTHGMGVTIKRNNLFDYDSVGFKNSDLACKPITIVKENNSFQFTNTDTGVACYAYTENISELGLMPNTTYTSKVIATLLDNGSSNIGQSGSMNLSLILQTNTSYDSSQEDKLYIVKGNNYYTPGTYELITTFTTPSDMTDYKYIVTRLANNTTIIFKDLQIELGSNATDYTPYVPDLTAVKVTRRGKNLFSGLTKGIGIHSTNGSEITNSNYAASDYIPVDFNANTNYYISGLPTTITNFVAAYNANKEFLGRTGGSVNSNYKMASAASFQSGTPQGTGDISYLRVCCYKTSANTGTINDIDGCNIQLEVGSSATEYEPYNSATFTPTADGTVEGVTSLYPNTTLTTDTDGVIIDCEYNRDINKAFAALEAAIATNNS